MTHDRQKLIALPLAHACRVNIVGYINPWEVPSVNNPNTIFPWILLFPSGLKVNPTLQYLYYTCTIIWWAWLCKLVSPHPGVCSALLAMLPVTYINIYICGKSNFRQNWEGGWFLAVGRLEVLLFISTMHNAMNIDSFLCDLCYYLTV